MKFQLIGTELLMTTFPALHLSQWRLLKVVITGFLILLCCGCNRNAPESESVPRMTAAEQQELNQKIQQIQANPGISASAKENIINGLKNSAAAKSKP